MAMIGKYDRRVTIQRRSEVRDSFGQVVASWVDVATVWARRMGRDGKDEFSADQHVSVLPVVFEIRFREDVAPKMRLVHRQTVYEIETIDEVARNETLRLSCYARDAVSGRS